VRHNNPYRINNPDDFFEVGENSSHPELQDCRRVWKFGAYSFSTATELQKFFSDEGLNPKNYVMEPIIQRDFSKNLIIINIIEKWKARQKQKLRELRLEQAS
jgi:hypothetical protein